MGLAPSQKALRFSAMSQVVSKALDGLCSFTPDHPDWGVTELASCLGLPKSTVHRLLITLEQYRFVQRTPLRRYRIGVRTLELGNVFRYDRKFLVSAEPLLRTLAMKTQSTAHLAQLEGREVLELLRVSAPGAVTMSPFPIFRMPAHATALGKVLLAWRGEDAFQQFVGLRKVLHRCTEHTIIHPENLSSQLDAVRELGYACSDQESRKGQVCLAVPVVSEKQAVVAALSVSGSVRQFRLQDYPKILLELSSTAKRISRCLRDQACPN
jgi:IclR family KDG regulon transcriptional repressor